ncbi:MAG: hypothetical protein C5B54_01505 [Acidobacteria bacterium]|nr:MAG: hypothetical protein C5B54_01505 [Acidobacteriota bacterium]
MILAIFGIIVLLFAFYTLMPYWSQEYRGRKLEEGSREREDLLHRKAEVVEALNDLEYDYKMKKMGESDYQHLKEKLTQQAVELMKKLDELQGIAPNAVRFQPRSKSRKARS